MSYNLLLVRRTALCCIVTYERKLGKNFSLRKHLRGALAAVFAWFALHSLVKESREYARLDWKSEEPLSNIYTGRATAATLAWELSRATMISHRIFEAMHINLLDVESPMSLLRRVLRGGIRRKRLLVLVDSRVVLGGVSKPRSTSRKTNFLLRKLRFWCFADDIALELVWVPTSANSADVFLRNKPV